MRQPLRKAFRILKAGNIYKVVYLAYLAVPLVDGADFPLQAKQGSRSTACLAICQKGQDFGLALEAVKPTGGVRFKLLPQFCPPLRMR